MQKRILWVLLAITLSLGYSNLVGKTIKQYKKEISSKSEELENIKKTIDEKEAEKEKYLKKEKEIKKELESINEELGELKKKGEQLRKNIKKAKKNLEKAEKELKLAGWEKKQWNETIDEELDLWYRTHHSHNKLFIDPVTRKLRVDALAQKKDYFDKAKKRESFYQNASIKWETAQKKLLDLESQHKAMLVKQNKVKKKKEKLLESAIGKRLLAEEEIKELSASKKALLDLINTLIKERKETEKELLARKEFNKKKGQLPWPVQGKVVAKFGKSKHPELDTYLISNGIKIQTGNNAEVKAVSSGEVMFCGDFRAYGQMIILDHKSGFYTIYGLLEDIMVEEEQKVNAYETIGKVGKNGNPVLYFEVRSGNEPEDPLLWLK
ncbi:MAG: peptidoglycan DD-metalloendopeptidase family protein [Endomicrobiales bacterium]|nr:peptidoglycan DD-metalloendopeptidase family protein [Endomicrobiales bacterium]